MQIILLSAVTKFLESLSEKEQARSLRTIELLEEFGASLNMPHTKFLSEGLMELRVRGSRQIRIFYCFYANQAVLLHACIKKSKKTPRNELHKAHAAKQQLHNYNL